MLQLLKLLLQYGQALINCQVKTSVFTRGTAMGFWDCRTLNLSPRSGVNRTLSASRAIRRITSRFPLNRFFHSSSSASVNKNLVVRQGNDSFQRLLRQRRHSSCLSAAPAVEELPVRAFPPIPSNNYFQEFSTFPLNHLGKISDPHPPTPMPQSNRGK